MTTVTVVGLGKIGLPLALQFAGAGAQVIGADTNPEVVEQVNAGREPFPGEHDLQRRLTEAVGEGALRATTDTTSAVADSDVVVVVVPLYVDADGAADFGWIDSATEAVGRGLKAGTLVAYETTLPIGTTRNRFGAILARESGLEPESDFSLAFSPERVFTGRVFADLRRYPKLVGGVGPNSTAAAIAFYAEMLEFDPRDDLPRPNGVWDLGSAEAAEFAKLAETTYRDVNIGLANQFAKHADAIGVDVRAVIEACNSQPFSHIHRPGVAVGGHCIPVYPMMYLSGDPSATVVRAAREANLAMPAYAVDRLSSLVGDLKGRAVCILGISYRGGVRETAYSGAFALRDELKARGATVYAHDPMYSDEEILNLNFEPLGLAEHVYASIIQADHFEYRSLSIYTRSRLGRIFDGRGIGIDTDYVLGDGRITTAKLEEDSQNGTN